MVGISQRHELFPHIDGNDFLDGGNNFQPGRRLDHRQCLRPAGKVTFPQFPEYESGTVKFIGGTVFLPPPPGALAPRDHCRFRPHLVVKTRNSRFNINRSLHRRYILPRHAAAKQRRGKTPRLFAESGPSLPQRKIGRHRQDPGRTGCLRFRAAGFRRYRWWLWAIHRITGLLSQCGKDMEMQK